MHQCKLPLLSEARLMNNKSEPASLPEQIQQIQQPEQLDLNSLSKEDICGLIEELQTQQKQNQFLVTLTETISEAKDFNEALQLTLKLVCEYTEWTYAEVWMPHMALELSPIYYIHQANDEKLVRFREKSKGLSYLSQTGLPGRVWSTKEPVWFRDVSKMVGEDFQRLKYAQRAGLKAALGMPIMAGETLLAVLIFYQTAASPQDEQKVALISAAATQLSHMLQRKQAETELAQYRHRLEAVVAARTDKLSKLNQQLQGEIEIREQIEAALTRRNRELTLLSHSAQAFNASLNQRETLITISQAVQHLLEVTACRAWIVDSLSGELVYQQTRRRTDQPESDKRLWWGEGLAGWVAEHNQSLIVPDIQTSTLRFKEIESETDRMIRAVAGVPLRVKGKVIGVLQALDATPNRFNEADLSLMEPLASTAAIALENAQLYEQAQHDADAKAVLLREVNHRVKNNLAAIIGLLHIKRRRFGLKDSDIYQAITEDIITQVQGLVTVHNLLSAAGWAPLQLSELVRQVARSVLSTLPRSNRVSLDISASPVRVTPEQANNLALILNELTTNAVKYATLDQTGPLKIVVRISLEQEHIQLEFRDNGPGYPKTILNLDPEAYSVGFEVIYNIVHKNLRGNLALHNDGGAVAVIDFAAEV